MLKNVLLVKEREWICGGCLLLMNEKYCYMTVLTNERYIPGVVALKKALDRVQASFPLTVLLPDMKYNALKEEVLGYIGKETKHTSIRFITHKEIDFILPSVEKEYDYWKETFFKLAVMDCTEYDKIVLLDSDMLIAQNIDELFDKPHMSAVMAGISARPDWKNFNSGLLVIEPNHEEYLRLLSCIEPAIKRRTQNGESTGDQDVFQECYADWYEHKELILSEKYNCLYGYLDKVCIAEDCRPKDIKIVHFVGSKKPWDYPWTYAIKKYLSEKMKHKRKERYLIDRMMIWLKYKKLCCK